MKTEENRILQLLCRIAQYEPKNAEEAVKQKAYIEVLQFILEEDLLG